MSRTEADIEGLVRYLVESLVDVPEAIEIAVSRTDEAVSFQVTLDPTDVGKVIGRGGRIIKAIRTLARAAGSTQGLQVEVDIVG